MKWSGGRAKRSSGTTLADYVTAIYLICDDVNCFFAKCMIVHSSHDTCNSRSLLTIFPNPSVFLSLHFCTSLALCLLSHYLFRFGFFVILSLTPNENRSGCSIALWTLALKHAHNKNDAKYKSNWEQNIHSFWHAARAATECALSHCIFVKWI